VTRTEGAAPGADELAILRLVNRWIVYRDNGDWERLRAIWHEDGTMTAGWQMGPADGFIAASKERWDDGRMKVAHELGAIEVEVLGDRAISQNKITITVRAELDGSVCDVTCMGRHFDRWEKRDGLWGLLGRQTIYDRDRLDTVVPGEVPKLDLDLLHSFGEPFRHIAYVFIKVGYAITPAHPAFRTPEGDALVSEWRAWLR
jgi:hypothetical protein